jgi:hypothetical protein
LKDEKQSGHAPSEGHQKLINYRMDNVCAAVPLLFQTLQVSQQLDVPTRMYVFLRAFVNVECLIY